MNMFQLDPLADLDAFINQMNAEMTDLGQADPIDWSDFLVDPSASDSESEQPYKKSGSPADNASPKSTESENSFSLDPKDDLFDIFNYDLPVIEASPLAGIMHSTEDLPAYNSLQTDVNMTDLGLADFVAKFAPPAPTPVVSAPVPQVDLSDALHQAYANMGWSDLAMAPVTSVQPGQLSLVSSPLPAAPSLKRKESDAADVDTPAKRPRGRPPKARADSSPLAEATPLVRAASIESDDAPIVKRTASGKPSTARPKSVVPEKYFKDGTAQQITGMTMEEILAFPTFEELLKQVKPELQAGAAEFGERIAENRDKAKDAAKKSREDRKAKVETLEKTIEGLEGKIKGMQGVLAALVVKGVLSVSDVQAFM